MPDIIQRKVVNMNYGELIPMDYQMNDLESVYTHYNPKTGRNEPTENKIKGVCGNGESGK